MKEEVNTEQAILKAAMDEFLEKGYAMSKTTDIARSAGVTHAMLHYYFRTKENLFNKVFQEKVQIMAHAFTSIMEGDLPFLDRIRTGIENHFDLVAGNQRLPFFVISELFANEERKDTCRDIFMPVINNELKSLQAFIDEEISKGTIRKITAINLFMSIISLNVFVFVASPIIKMITQENDEEYAQFLEKRKMENVEIILSRLRI